MACKTKLFIAGILSLTFLTSCGGNSQQSSEGSQAIHFVDEEGMRYDQFADGWHITDYQGEKAHVIVPSQKSSEGLTLPVVAIESNAFYGRSVLTGIELPSTVTKIGKNAFSNTSLETLFVTVSLAEVADDAFSDCPFGNNEDKSVLYLPSRDNPYCIAYKKFPAKLDYECPDGIERALDNVFRGATFTNKPDFSKLRYVGKYAFAETGISGDLHLEECLEIGQGAFLNNAEISAVNLPKIKTLGEGAFEKDQAIKTVYLGSDLQSVGSLPFKSCNQISKAEVPFVGKDKSNPENLSYLFDPITLENLTINGGNIVTAFCNYSIAIVNLTLNNVETVQEEAFYQRSTLKSLTLNNVTTIQDRAFRETGLTEVFIPKTVKKLGYGAFYTGNNFILNLQITEDELPNYDYEIDRFSLGTLASVRYGADDPGTGGKATTPDGWTYSTVGSDAFIEAYDGSSNTITIPTELDGRPIKGISKHVFETATNVTSLTIPSYNDFNPEEGFLAPLTKLAKLDYCQERIMVPYRMFGKQSQSGLYSITRKSGSTTVTYYVPSSLKTLVLRDKIISEQMFQGFKSLTAVTFREEGVSIYKYAFAYCSGIQDFYIPANSFVYEYGLLDINENATVRVHESNKTDNWGGSAGWTNSKNVIIVSGPNS